MPKAKKNESDDEDKPKKKTKNSITGLQISTGRIKTALRRYCENTIGEKPKITTDTYIFITSVLEQICRILIETAVPFSHEKNKKGNNSITRTNLVHAIEKEKKLMNLFLLPLKDYDTTKNYGEINMITETDYNKVLKEVDTTGDGIVLTEPAMAMVKYLINYLFEDIARISNNNRSCQSKKRPTITIDNTVTAFKTIDKYDMLTKISKNALKDVGKIEKKKKSKKDKKDKKNKKSKKEKKSKKKEESEEDE